MHQESLANLVRMRAEAYARFEEWAHAHPMTLAPAAAVAAIGSLLEMMPVAARRRPVDPTGIARMHDALAHLS